MSSQVISSIERMRSAVGLSYMFLSNSQGSPSAGAAYRRGGLIVAA